MGAIGGGGVRLQLQPSRDSPHLVVLHRKVLILPLLLRGLPMLMLPPPLLLLLLRWLSECGAASSKRVGVRAGKASGGLRSIAAGINADITRAPSSVAAKARSVGCIAMNCELIVLAFKACGRVVVRILDKEQEADGARGWTCTLFHTVGITRKHASLIKRQQFSCAQICISPGRMRISAERVPRGGAHDDQRRPLPHTVSMRNLQQEVPCNHAPDCRSAGGTRRCCGRPCSTCTAGGSVCL